MAVQQDNGSGSIEPSDQELRINLELGAWSISRRIDAKDRSRLVIQCVEDDFGGLCPHIGLETKGLVHYGGRAAVSVQTDHGVVVLPPPAAATRGQQQYSSNQPRARGSKARAAQVQLGRVTGALNLRGVGLTGPLVAAVAQVVLVRQLAATTVAATADSQSPSSREGSREVVTTQQQQQGELQTGWRAKRNGRWNQRVTAQRQRMQQVARQSHGRNNNNSSRHNHRQGHVSRQVRRKQQQQKAQT